LVVRKSNILNTELIKELVLKTNPSGWSDHSEWTKEQLENFTNSVVNECINQIQLQRVKEELEDVEPEFVFRKSRARAFRYAGLWTGIKSIKSHFGIL